MAYAYSYITYWTAWIKANFPLVFYTAMFNGNLPQLSEFMAEAKKRGITVLPPHASHSKYESTIESKENNVIRIGLNAIKGVGPTAVDSITLTQPYESIDDFFERNNSKAVNKKVINALIGVDAFKGLGVRIERSDLPAEVLKNSNYYTKEESIYLTFSRNQMIKWAELFYEVKDQKPIPNYAIPWDMLKGKYQIEENLAIKEKDDTLVIPENRLSEFDLELENVLIYKTRKRPKKHLANNTDNLKDVSLFRRPIISNYEQIFAVKENYLESYLTEVEELGYSFLAHPLENKKDLIANFSEAKDGEYLQIAGIVTELIPRITKNNKKYYWVIIQTPREKVRVTIWNNQYISIAKDIQLKNVLLIKGIKGYGGMGLDFIQKLKFNN